VSCVTIKDNRLIASFLGLLLGFLFTLAFAPHSFWLVAWIIPGLVLIQGLNNNQRTYTYFLFTFYIVFYSSSLFWVSYTLTNFTESYLISFFIWTFMIIFFSGISSICLLIWKRYLAQNFAYALAFFPIVWLTQSLLRSNLFGGFPWLWLAYSQTTSSWIHLAPYVGVYGLTLLMLYTSCVIMTFFYCGKRTYAFFLALLFFSISVILSFSSSSQINSSLLLNIGVVQANIDFKQKWNPYLWTSHMDQYKQLSRKLNSQIVVWPESALPGQWPVNGTSLKEVANQLSKISNPPKTILTGALLKTDSNKFVNALINTRHLEKRYDKIHLVPFGEFTPLNVILKPIQNLLTIPMSSLTAGSTQQGPIFIKNHWVNAFICYDIAYTSWPQYNKDTELLLVITDDMWFHSKVAIKQHRQIASFRAAELNKSLLFVNNNGLSALIDHHGQIVTEMPFQKMAATSFNVPLRKGLTPIGRFYKWIKWL
jgi:apolipoprotein N-acyltransferase